MWVSMVRILCEKTVISTSETMDTLPIMIASISIITSELYNWDKYSVMFIASTIKSINIMMENVCIGPRFCSCGRGFLDKLL